MQRMSGIALTPIILVKFNIPIVKFLTPAKPLPASGIQKMGSSYCGGHNHRMGLFDAIMIKDNHIDICHNLSNALEKTKTTC